MEEKYRDRDEWKKITEMAKTPCKTKVENGE